MYVLLMGSLSSPSSLSLVSGKSGSYSYGLASGFNFCLPSRSMTSFACALSLLILAVNIIPLKPGAPAPRLRSLSRTRDFSRCVSPANNTSPAWLSSVFQNIYTLYKLLLTLRKNCSFGIGLPANLAKHISFVCSTKNPALIKVITECDGCRFDANGRINDVILVTDFYGSNQKPSKLLKAFLTTRSKNSHWKNRTKSFEAIRLTGNLSFSKSSEKGIIAHDKIQWNEWKLGSNLMSSFVQMIDVKTASNNCRINYVMIQNSWTVGLKEKWLIKA